MAKPSSESEFPSDQEIARSADRQPIEDVAESIGLGPDDLDPQGSDVAKLSLDAVRDVRDREADGTLVLVTGMTPTPMGEGKTVTTVGLGQALDELGERTAIAVREPSLGPVFGIKGGAAGGGYAQVLPMEDINLHFTGDLHALTAAHNLLSAALDAHLHHGNELEIDVADVSWPRVLDMNDRALRQAVVGLGGTTNGVPREDRFQITAASELMAILCLAEDYADLKARIDRIVVARNEDGEAVTAADIGVSGAVAALLRDALRPNLVQAIGGVPAFVHGGPFANIAHGTNSVLADRAGLVHADYVVTEAGFGADLGAEKFFDIVARESGLTPDATVVVATVRALKRHGKEMWPADFDELSEPDPDAVLAGLDNLLHHVGVLERFGAPATVAINRFPADTDEEIETLLDALDEHDVPAAVSNVHGEGGKGGIELAKLVKEAAERGGDAGPLYDASASIEEKLETVATEVYGADGVEFVGSAADDIERIEDAGLDDLPICLSKTPYSISDDASKTGAPEGWTLSVRELYPSAGAGFIVALTGSVLTMPGLPANPAAAEIDLTDDGEITGLF